MSFRLAMLVLALAVCIFPNVATPHGQDTDNATHIVTGCLRKGVNAKTFLLSDENGKEWVIHSNGVKLSAHVGHTVTLHGTIPKQPKNSSDTSPQNELVVTRVEMVRDSCTQQQ
jgi:hypothetical protein